MKPEEIMIGDLVIHGFGGIGKITEIDSKTVVIKDDGFDIGDGMNEVSFALNELTPIPLTDEILKKNGFENDFYHDECVADYHFVRLEGYSYREDFILVTWCNGELNVVNDLIGEVEIHCENVHELQHALKLCGINKEIEI